VRLRDLPARLREPPSGLPQEPWARLRELWGISRFRLTVMYGALFALGIVALLALIYWQTAGYMVRQLDDTIRADAQTSLTQAPEQVDDWIAGAMARDVGHVKYYGLFAPDGRRVIGNILSVPSVLKIGAPPRQFALDPSQPPDIRALAVKLQDGSTLILGRNTSELRQIRSIILHALFWSGAVIVVAGLGLGAAFSAQPLRRVQAIGDASARIREGDFHARLPISPQKDELDALAAIVNAMLDEVQRLVSEVKSASDSLAHDLRTPLTRLRAQLHRIDQQPDLPEVHRDMLEEAIEETDILLTRFRALLRISEIESRERRSGFGLVDLGEIAGQIREMYGPVAASRDIALDMQISPTPVVDADKELLFEAISNLVDNAIKFTPDGGQVKMRAVPTPQGPRLEVTDTGPGVPAEERSAVLQRFYRGSRESSAPGSGLGLSIVAAILRLHGFELQLQEADPGLRISVNCWPNWAKA
jgi:signal transduction histidine kinase